MNKIEKTMNGVMANIPKGVKLAALNGTIIAGLLSGCGRTVGTDPVTTPAPTTSIETTIDDPVVDDNVVDPGEVVDNSCTQVSDEQLPDATFIQTGDGQYTLYVDAADNSNAPEVQETMNMWGDELQCESYGVSSNLVNAVLTYGIQSGESNIIQFSDEYKDNPFELLDCFGDAESDVITDNPELYNGDGHRIGILSDYKYNGEERINSHIYSTCIIIVRDSINNTNGNITCGLARYNAGPETWSKIMEECMDATGLTEEEIYANFNAKDVYQYDTLGLGNPDYADEVLSYVNGDIVITTFGAGGIESTATYIIERV